MSLRPSFFIAFALAPCVLAASSCTGHASSAHPNGAGSSAYAEMPATRAGRSGAARAQTPDAGTAHDAAVARDAGTADAQTASDMDGGNSATAHDAGAHTRDAGAMRADASAAGDDAGCQGPPGLYKGTRCEELADGVQAYHPRFPLWSDGAAKERFIYLPAGTHIDTSNPDRWTFPLGTRLYKTFAFGALKVETRLVEKTSNSASYNAWKVVTYAWNAEQTRATLADANGVVNPLGTQFDIPSQLACQNCHAMNAADAAIGFNAIQLNHDEDGLNLRRLLADGRLVNERDPAHPNIDADSAIILGDAETQAALGYLHGNCGHCHGGPNPRANQLLWYTVGTTALKDAPIFRTAVCQCLVSWTGRKNDAGDAYELRVVPSHEALSGIVGRMSSRVRGEQMPPVGTKLVDATGLAAVERWIAALDPASCEGATPSCPP